MLIATKPFTMLSSIDGKSRCMLALSRLILLAMLKP